MRNPTMVKLKKSIRRLVWRFRPWAKVRRLEKELLHHRELLAKQRSVSTEYQQALRRKKVALVELGVSYAKAVDQLQHFKCPKIKHATMRDANKACAKFFNQKSQVMEPYECFACPKNPDNNERWWHIRHVRKAERGKFNHVRKDSGHPEQSHGDVHTVFINEDIPEARSYQPTGSDSGGED